MTSKGRQLFQVSRRVKPPSKGNTNFQRRVNLQLREATTSKFKGGLNLPIMPSREATTSNFKAGLNHLHFPLPSTQEYIRDNKPLHQNITINNTINIRRMFVKTQFILFLIKYNVSTLHICHAIQGWPPAANSQSDRGQNNINTTNCKCQLPVVSARPRSQTQPQPLCSRPHDDLTNATCAHRQPHDLCSRETTTNFVKCFKIDVWLIYKQSFDRKIVWPKDCLAELSFDRKIVRSNNCSAKRGLSERKYPTD